MTDRPLNPAEQARLRSLQRRGDAPTDHRATTFAPNSLNEGSATTVRNVLEARILELGEQFDAAKDMEQVVGLQARRAELLRLLTSLDRPDWQQAPRKRSPILDDY